MDDKNTTSCGFTRLKFTLRKPTLYPAELHERAYKSSKQSAQAEKSATAHFLFRVVYFIAVSENYSPL